MSAHELIGRTSGEMLHSGLECASASGLIIGAVILIVTLGSVGAKAESTAVDSQSPSRRESYPQPGSSLVPSPEPNPTYPQQEPSSMGENEIFWHVLFNQLEGRSNGPDNELRWDGQGWIGTNWNKLWFKSEAFFNNGQNNGKMEDGIQEVLYDRPIPFLRYFDWQTGFRYDGDCAPPRYWGALGIQGLAPEFFDFEATAYLRNGGHFAARLVGSYDILLTNRLIAEPEIEMNFYSKGDPGRAIGRGLSELDTGLRLRYEISRKFAPYVGFAYTQQCGGTAGLVRREGNIVYDPRLVFGIRTWY
jgi:copper resistance protein B